MLTLRKVDVPKYLRASEFYKSLNDDVDGDFSVPVDCFKADPNTTDEKSIRNLLSTLRFWGVRNTLSIAFESTLYCADDNLASIVADFGEDYKSLKTMREMVRTETYKWLEVAAENGDLAILKLLMAKNGGEVQVCFAICAAARCGHLECLKYLRSATSCSCWCAELVCLLAIDGHSQKCFAYAFDFIPDDPLVSTILDHAVSRRFSYAVLLICRRGYRPRRPQELSRICMMNTGLIVEFFPLCDWSEWCWYDHQNYEYLWLLYKLHTCILCSRVNTAVSLVVTAALVVLIYEFA